MSRRRRHERRDDDNFDAEDDEDRQPRDPGGEAKVIVAILVLVGIGLVAFQVLDLRLDDFGGHWFALGGMVVFVIIVRGGFLRR